MGKRVPTQMMYMNMNMLLQFESQISQAEILLTNASNEKPFRKRGEISLITLMQKVIDSLIGGGQPAVGRMKKPQKRDLEYQTTPHEKRAEIERSLGKISIPVSNTGDNRKRGR